MESEPSYKDLEIVSNEYSDRDYNINVSVPEFNCVCPRTGLPDFATIKIQYVPDKHIIELKSLKLYMVKFRNLGIFHEHVTNRILDDLVRAANPKKINIVGDFHPRGGVKTSVDANWEK
tara:strand:- start:5811 stop:6167 length:357 start_codon:yes stop_codon:yes gene_type:complete